MAVGAAAAAEFKASRAVHLGSWSEPELLAAGVPHVKDGDPTVAGASSSFSRLDEAERMRQVNAALENLVSRGLVRRAGDEAAAGEPMPGSPLELVRGVSGDPVFFGAWAAAGSGVETGSPCVTGSAYGVRIPPTGFIAILDERIDFATNIHDFTLRSPEDYVSLVASDVFADDAWKDGGSTWHLSLTWAKGGVKRRVQWMTARLPHHGSATMVRLRSYGLRRKDSGHVTKDELHRGLAEVFTEVCAAQPGPRHV